MNTEDYLKILYKEKLVGSGQFQQNKSGRTYQDANGKNTKQVRTYVPLSHDYQFEGCSVAQVCIPQSSGASKKYHSWSDVSKDPWGMRLQPFTSDSETLLGMSLNGMKVGNLAEGQAILKGILDTLGVKVGK